MKILPRFENDFQRERLRFLPMALEIQQTPPHPMARWLAWLLILFLFIALVWACVGKIDVVAVAQGKIIPSARVKQIQPLEKGIIKEIFVHEGQRVKAGEALVVMDSTRTRADRDRMANELREAGELLARSKAFLALLHNGSDSAGSDDPLLQQQWQQYNAALAVLRSQLDNRMAEKQQNSELISKLEATLPMISQRADHLKILADKKMVAHDQYLQLEEQRVGHRQDLAAAKAHDAQLVAAIAESQQQIAGLVAQAQGKTLSDIDDSERKVKSLTEEWRKAEDSDARQVLYAPVAGQVKDLVVNTVGGVVLEAQQLMLIVPEEEQLEVQAWLPNQDIGFVREHDVAQIKVHTFPFTKYGTIPATIARISEDAVADEKQAREQGGLVYSVSLLMEKNSLWVDTRNVKLMPGMQVTAEIITGQRRIIEYFLSPLQQHFQESVRER